MSYKDYEKIIIYEFRLVKTLDEMGFRRYLLMTKFKAMYKENKEESQMMWSASLIQEMAKRKDDVGFKDKEFFINGIEELKDYLQGATKTSEKDGISFILYNHIKPDQSEEMKSGIFITNLAEKLFKKSMTIEAYTVLGENLVAIYKKCNEEVWSEDEKLWLANVFESGETYLWERISRADRILDLCFNNLSEDSIEMRYRSHLIKAIKLDADEGYVIAVRRYGKLYYVSGIRNRKGAEDNLFLLNPDIDMAAGFVNEDRALKTILSLEGMDLYEDFEIQKKRRDFFSTYVFPPSILMT